jgi:hypothetical protein
MNFDRPLSDDLRAERLRLTKVVAKVRAAEFGGGIWDETLRILIEEVDRLTVRLLARGILSKDTVVNMDDWVVGRTPELKKRRA